MRLSQLTIKSHIENLAVPNSPPFFKEGLGVVVFSGRMVDLKDKVYR